MNVYSLTSCTGRNDDNVESLALSSEIVGCVVLYTYKNASYEGVTPLHINWGLRVEHGT